MNELNHVAIIMDGNGRWGLKKKKSRNLGHKAGLNTVENIIKHTIKNKIMITWTCVRHTYKTNCFLHFSYAIADFSFV